MASRKEEVVQDETPDEVVIDSVPMAKPVLPAGTEIARRISNLTVAVGSLVAAVIVAAILS